jgi:hypothetical protein
LLFRFRSASQQGPQRLFDLAVAVEASRDGLVDEDGALGGLPLRVPSRRALMMRSRAPASVETTYRIRPTEDSESVGHELCVTSV